MRLFTIPLVVLAIVGSSLAQEAPQLPARKPGDPEIKPEIKIVNGNQVVVIGKMEFDLQQGIGVMKGPNGATFTMSGNSNKVEAVDAGRKIAIVEHQDKSQLVISVTEPRAKAKAATEAEAKKITALINDLDSNAFPVRQSATDALEKLGLVAEAALCQALEARPSLETRQRLETLLQRLEPQPTTYKARNAKELMKAQPEIYKLYKKWMIDEWVAGGR